MAREKSGKPGRIKQIREAYRLTKPGDPRLGLILLGTFVFAALVGTALMILIPPDFLVLDIVVGVMFGLLGTLIVFGRRATKSQIKQIEGKPGAALAVLRVLRRRWRTDEMIAFTKQQDVVHRLTGPPGIVLLGEGDPQRVKQLMTAEQRRHQRVVADVPVHQVVVGNAEGQIPLGKLARHLTKMKKQITPAQMTDIVARLRAIDASRPAVPLPKGPVPTSMKGMRGQMRGR
ncbi:DUF4191 domain-containing protein [Nocardioides sp. HDW12B]|uniref:DUF4191 domain-containing protein n=1 Tax=Nocardioides sp. HDW12B TaxID=2714939 RepID=UPI00140BADA6|nr:DUF4191 domain-containing protein [Nocardioides sp. HDW12B]QIK66026.1 DUF4191 domain-containing protein [Nocardioides sp. HDW12B]